MRTILALMTLAMAVMVMGCGEPATPTTDAGTDAAAVATGCDCCKSCDKCEDGKKCECTSKDGSDCDCKCKDGAAEGEMVKTEIEEVGAKVDVGSDHSGSDDKSHSGSDHK